MRVAFDYHEIDDILVRIFAWQPQHRAAADPFGLMINELAPMLIRARRVPGDKCESLPNVFLAYCVLMLNLFRSTRAAAYGTRSLVQNLVKSKAETTVILQIEDAEAIQHVSRIAQTDGVDALFIGTMDLAVSLGAQTPQDPTVMDAIEHVIRECRNQHLACGIFCTSARDACYWAQKGLTFFLLESDQQWMMKGATESVRVMPEIKSIITRLNSP